MAFLTLAACSASGERGASGRVRTRGSTVHGGHRTSGGAGRSDVELISRGTGDRRRLRLRLHRGAITHLSVEVTLGVDQTVAGQHTVISSPAIIETLELRITDVAEDHTARYRYEVTAVEVGTGGSLSPSAEASLRQRVRQLVGLSGSGRVSDRGKTLSHELDLPASLTPELRSRLEQLDDQIGTLSVPLPEQAVGTGARWTADSEAKLSGATIDFATSYRLLGAERGRFRIAIEQRQSAARQPIDLPTAPAGVTGRIVAWDVRTHGENTLKLGTIFPDADLRGGGEQTLSLVSGRRKPEILRQRLTLAVKITDVGN